MATEFSSEELNGTPYNVKPGTIAAINGQRYDLSTLSESALKLLASVKMAEEEVTKLERSLTIARAARVAYSQALFVAVKDFTPVEGDKE